MAVQAQYPSNVLLPEASWTRMRNLLSGDDKSVITPVLFGHPVNNTIEDFRMLSAAAAGAANPFLFSSPFLVSNPGLAPCGDFPAAENELNSNIWNNMYNNDNHPRKRLRESAPEEEHVRQNLVEKTQKHAKALLYAVAEGVSRKLREKDLQVVNINRRNMELEERIKHLINESRAWQNRAKNSEVLANALRMNIEQRRDEQIKEGCGDSEEDAASCQLIGDINNVAVTVQASLPL